MNNSFRRELLTSAAILVGGVLAVSLGLYWLSNDLDDLTVKIVTGRAVIAKQTQIIGDLAELKRDSIQARVYAQAISGLLVTKDQLIDFPHWLDELARSRHVDLSFSFDNTPVPAQGDLPAYNGFSIGVGGALENDIDFIRDIESRAPRFLVNLTSFEVVRNGSDYRITSHGQVYFK